MKVFVTGATGVLGQRVIQRLINQNILVVALSRSSQNSDLLKKLKVQIKEADLFNRNEIIEATKGCDAILHFATSIPKKQMTKLSDWKMNDKIRVDGTRNLIDAAIENGIRRFICPSVTALYGQQNGNFVSTETPLPEPFEMGKSAIEMEKMICDKLPNQYLIIRFGNYYSDDDFHTNNLIANVSKGKMPMLGKGNFYLNWIHLDDAADAIVFGLNNFETLKGKIVNATDYNPILYSDMLNGLSAITTKKKAFYLPMFLAKWILGKSSFAFLTNSYRVKRDPVLKGWQPKHTDFITSITEIVKQKKRLQKPQ